MKIEVAFKEQIAILKLAGELDMATVDSLLDKVKELMEDYSRIIFDFSELKFVDSTGIGNLVKLFRDNEQKLEYAITNLQEDVKEIFTILNLEEILGTQVFIDSNQQALDFLRE